VLLVPGGVKRRNHTVNGAYLTRFADDRGMLAGIELPGRAFPVPVDGATVITNFYVARLPDGSECDQAEDDSRDIEARRAGRHRHVGSPGVPPRPGRA
jgi:hypothetical protein